MECASDTMQYIYIRVFEVFQQKYKENFNHKIIITKEIHFLLYLMCIIVAMYINSKKNYNDCHIHVICSKTKIIENFQDKIK